MDPRDDRTSVIRFQLRRMLVDFIKSPTGPGAPSGGAPSLPPVAGAEPRGNSLSQEQASSSQQPQGQQTVQSNGFQLPPLTFEAERAGEPARALTPITERESTTTHNNAAQSFDSQQAMQQPQEPQPQPVSTASPVSPESGLSASPLSSPWDRDNTPAIDNVVTRSSAALSPPPQPVSGSYSSLPYAGRASLESSRTNGSSISPLSPNRGAGSSLASLTQSTSATSNQQSTSLDTTVLGSKEGKVASSQPDFKAGPSQPAPSAQKSPPASDRNNDLDLVNEAGALYYMQQAESSTALDGPKQQPVNFDDDDDTDSTSEVDLPKSAQKQPAKASTIDSDTNSHISDTSSRRAPVRQSTPMSFFEGPSAKGTTSGTNQSIAAPNQTTSPPNASPPLGGPSTVASYAEYGPKVSVDRGYAAGRSALGRKPSGARAPQPLAKGLAGSGSASSSIQHQQQLASQYEEEEEENAQQPPHQQSNASKEQQPMASVAKAQTQEAVTAGFDDPSEALAALAYLDVSEGRVPSVSASGSVTSSSSPPPAKVEPVANRGFQESASTSEVKSSFAPSRQAEERKKKAQAQQAAIQASVNKPGRANGKKKLKQAGSWVDSSDEEEEEEEEEDEDVDSDGEPSNAPPPPRMQQQQVNASFQAQQLHQQQSFLPSSSVYPSLAGDGQQTYSHVRPPRTLPQPPGVGSRPPGALPYYALLTSH